MLDWSGEVDMFREFVALNLRACRACDRFFFNDFSVDGNRSFNEVAPTIIADGQFIADVGGGKTPFFPPSEVRERHLHVTGVDIDGLELASAPKGAYEEVMVTALEACQGGSNHDVVVAQSVLEHVVDGREAMRGISTLLRPGGTVITFCPNRRAWFARLNLILPEKLKRAILFSVFPSKRERQGFPAHYDGCTPREMIKNMADFGIELVECRYYFVSSYFMFFFPLYLLWRLANYPLMRFWPERYCETFLLIGKKVVKKSAAGA
ncbi:class I SAM-dependent methyltransferase [Thermomonas fusca]